MADRIGELFGLSYCHLKRLVEAGEIRKRKLGQDHRATAIYSCFDVIEWLEGGAEYPANANANANADTEGTEIRESTEATTGVAQ